MGILIRGITGFDTQAKVDFRAFKKAVHAASQVAGGTVASAVEADGVTPNFHHADIVCCGRQLSVICNRSFPVVAVVQWPIESCGVEPVDVPQLTAVIRESGFEVASAAEFQRPVTENDLASLSEAGRQQAKYWKPRRVVDLVFNWWD